MYVSTSSVKKFTPILKANLNYLKDTLMSISFGMHQNQNFASDCLPRPGHAAESKNEYGNRLYQSKEYDCAACFFTEAIDLSPATAIYYANRAACYMMLNHFSGALKDAQRAAQLDRRSVNAYVIQARCGIAMGDFTTLENALERVQDLQPRCAANEREFFHMLENERILILTFVEKMRQYEKDAKGAYNGGDFLRVVALMNSCLEASPLCNRFKLSRAEALVFLGKYEESKKVAESINAESVNADAIYVLGLCLFCEDNIEGFFQNFQKVLRIEPGHSKASKFYEKAKLLVKKKEEATRAYKQDRFQEAVTLYTECLGVDLNVKRYKMKAKLYFARALAYYKLKKINNAVKDCTEALLLHPTYFKAFLHRARCYMVLEDYENAVNDYEKVCKLGTKLNRRKYRLLLLNAIIALKHYEIRDYYTILGVKRDTSARDIKKAYRKKAFLVHPDRHRHVTNAEKNKYGRRFRQLTEIYKVLHDPVKRAEYDRVTLRGKCFVVLMSLLKRGTSIRLKTLTFEKF